MVLQQRDVQAGDEEVDRQQPGVVGVPTVCICDRLPPWFSPHPFIDREGVQVGGEEVVGNREAVRGDEECAGVIALEDAHGGEGDDTEREDLLWVLRLFDAAMLEDEGLG